VEDACECDNEPSGSVNAGNFLTSCKLVSSSRRSLHIGVSEVHQILEKKWEYNEEVNQLFIDFKKTNDSVRRVGLI